MSVIELMLAAKQRGVSFFLRPDGSMVTNGLERLPAALRRDVLLNIETIRALIAEHSIIGVRPIDVYDRARAIVSDAKPPRPRSRVRANA